MQAQKRIYLLPVISTFLFIFSIIILYFENVPIEFAFIWMLLSSLDINFDILPKNVIDTPFTLTADLISAFIFALIAVFFGAVFFNLINNIDFNERKIISKIKKLKNHVIITPLNDFAETFQKEFEENEINSVIIGDNKKEIDAIRRKGYLAVMGNPKLKESFDIANIKDAQYVISCSDNDLDNVVIIVSAKAAKSKIKIISRVTTLENIAKLGNAGAYRMIMPEITTGSEIGEELLKHYT
jgi:voltage-gated potassium channel Kch